LNLLAKICQSDPRSHVSLALTVNGLSIILVSFLKYLSISMIEVYQFEKVIHE
jgi:hypothetical protein